MPEFDLRDDVIGILDLVNLDTPDGEFGFLLGVDGVFTDVNGKVWVGSTALGSDRLQSAINGVAPEGRIAFSFFQDPQQLDLVEQVKALGIEYLSGRAISFWYQPISSVAELSAPVLPPRKWLTRTIRTLSVRANGARDRTLSPSARGGVERQVSAPSPPRREPSADMPGDVRTGRARRGGDAREGVCRVFSGRFSSAYGVGGASVPTTRSCSYGQSLWGPDGLCNGFTARSGHVTRPGTLLFSLHRSERRDKNYTCEKVIAFPSL